MLSRLPRRCPRTTERHAGETRAPFCGGIGFKFPRTALDLLAAAFPVALHGEPSWTWSGLWSCSCLLVRWCTARMRLAAPLHSPKCAASAWIKACPAATLRTPPSRRPFLRPESTCRARPPHPLCSSAMRDPRQRQQRAAARPHLRPLPLGLPPAQAHRHPHRAGPQHPLQPPPRGRHQSPARTRKGPRVLCGKVGTGFPTRSTTTKAWSRLRDSIKKERLYSRLRSHGLTSFSRGEKVPRREHEKRLSPWGEAGAPARQRRTSSAG